MRLQHCFCTQAIYSYTDKIVCGLEAFFLDLIFCSIQFTFDFSFLNMQAYADIESHKVVGMPNILCLLSLPNTKIPFLGVNLHNILSKLKPPLT